MMKDRIKQIMDSLKLSQQDFAAKLGISPASLSNIFNGRSNPTNNHVQAIHRAFPEINVDWLMFGEGNMLRGNSSADLAHSANAGTADKEKTSDGVSRLDIIPDSSQKEESPDLFSALNRGKVSSTDSGRQVVKVEPKVIRETKIIRPKVVEIRVFYDDQTFESFVPSGKQNVPR